MSNRNAPVWVKFGSSWKCLDADGVWQFADARGLGNNVDSRGWNIYKSKATTPCGIARDFSNHMDFTWCPSKPLKKGDSYYHPDFSKIRR